MHLELLALLYYTDDFWERNGPLDPELARAVAEPIKALIRYFVDAVTAHRLIWDVNAASATNVSMGYTMVYVVLLMVLS